MTKTQDELLAALTRPIIGIENRSAQEAFDIMADRIQSALRSPDPEVERLRGALEFYADEPAREFPSDGPWGVNSDDFGRVARAALSTPEGE